MADTTSRTPRKRSSPRTAPPPSKQWYSAALRSMTALLIVFVAFGYFIIQHQQRTVASLQSEVHALRSLGIAAPGEVVLSEESSEPKKSDHAATDTETALSSWAIRFDPPTTAEGSTTCRSDSSNQRLVTIDRAGQETTVIEYLPVDATFGVALLLPQPNTAEAVLLSSVPCDTALETAVHPLHNFSATGVQYWIVRRADPKVEPIDIAQLLGCPDHGAEAVMNAPALSFCFPNAWIAEEIIPEPSGQHTGTLATLRFTGGRAEMERMRLELASSDFGVTGETDARPFPYALDLALPDAELRERLAVYGNVVSFDRVAIGGVPALRVTFGVPQIDPNDPPAYELAYVVPGAYLEPGHVPGVHHIVLRSTNPDLESGLDALVGSIFFPSASP